MLFNPSIARGVEVLREKVTGKSLRIQREGMAEEIHSVEADSYEVYEQLTSFASS